MNNKKQIWSLCQCAVIGNLKSIKAKEQDLKNWNIFNVYKEIQNNGEKMLTHQVVMEELLVKRK